MPPTDFPALSQSWTAWQVALAVLVAVVPAAACGLMLWRSFVPKTRLGWGWVLFAQVSFLAVMFAFDQERQASRFANDSGSVSGTMLSIASAGLYAFLVMVVVCLLGVIERFVSTEDTVRAGVMSHLLLAVTGGLCSFPFLVPRVASGPRTPMSVCRNRMQAISLGLVSHAETFPQQPIPAASAGTPPISWRLKLAPFLNAAEQYNAYNPAQPWDSKANHPVACSAVEVLTCPADLPRSDPLGRKYTSYAMLTGPRAAFPDGRPAPDLDIRGKSNSAIMIEACGRWIV